MRFRATDRAGIVTRREPRQSLRYTQIEGRGRPLIVHHETTQRAYTHACHSQVLRREFDAVDRTFRAHLREGHIHTRATAAGTAQDVVPAEDLAERAALQ